MNPVEKSPKRRPNVRKPLGQIKANEVNNFIQQNDLKLVKKPEASGKENIDKFQDFCQGLEQLNLDKVTKRGCDEGDRSFLEATTFFDLLEASKSSYVHKNHEEKNVELPRRKFSLRKVRQVEKRKDVERVFYKRSLYDRDHHENNLTYMLETETKLVLRHDVLSKRCDAKLRMEVVHLFMEKCELLKIMPGCIFIIVQLFDRVLVEMNPKSEEYEIIALTCFWLAQKFYSNKSTEVFSMLLEGYPEYNKKDITRRERDILRMIDFNIDYTEPATFLYYFMEYHGLILNGTIRSGAMLLLECCTFFLEFSCSSKSFMAATALYSSMKHLNYTDKIDTFLTFFDNNFFAKSDLIKCADAFHQRSIKFLNEYGRHAEFIKMKYSRDEHYNIIKRFASN